MKLTCIICPRGCSIDIEKQGEGFSVSGNSCLRGEKYAIQELTAPKRTLTIVMFTDKGNVVSVKSNGEIPKEKISDCIEVLKKTVPKEPINIGDVVYANILNLGVDIVATRNIGGKL